LAKADVLRIFLLSLYLGISFGWVLPLPASDNSAYQKAYEMEKRSTLFAIPLYEQALKQTQNPKIQKAVVGRLFFLQKKHHKFFEALLLSSRFPKLVSSSERKEVWESISRIYSGVAISDLQQTYQLVFRSDPNSFEELKFHLLSLQKKTVLDFVFLLLYKKKDYDLGGQLIRSDLQFQTTPLYEGMFLFKSNLDAFRDFLEGKIREQNITEVQRSDLNFLLGFFFRARGDYANSARFFRMSARGKLESAKSLLLAGSPEEACRSMNYSVNAHEEYVQLFYQYCQAKNPEFWKEVYPGIQAFEKKDSLDLLRLFFPERESTE